MKNEDFFSKPRILRIIVIIMILIYSITPLNGTIETYRGNRRVPRRDRPKRYSLSYATSTRHRNLNENEYSDIDIWRSIRNRTNRANEEIYETSFLKNPKVDENNLFLSIKIIPLNSVVNYPFDEYFFYNDGIFIRKEYLRNSKLPGSLVSTGGSWSTSDEPRDISEKDRIAMEEARIALIEERFDRNESMKIRKNYFNYNINNEYNSSILSDIVDNVSGLDYEKKNNLKLTVEGLQILSSEDELVRKADGVEDSLREKKVFLNRKEIDQTEIPISMIFEIRLMTRYYDGLPSDSSMSNRFPEEEIEIVFWLVNNEELYENDHIKKLINFLNFMDEIYGIKIQN